MFVTDNCKDCVSCCAHAGKDREFICPGGVSCKITKRRGMTNADRIRAMSDEELANFIPDWSHTKACKCNEHEFIGCDNQCEKCVLDWLKQPAEES